VAVEFPRLALVLAAALWSAVSIAVFALLAVVVYAQQGFVLLMRLK